MSHHQPSALHVSKNDDADNDKTSEQEPLVLENDFASFELRNRVLTMTIKPVNRPPTDDEWTATKEYVRCFYRAALGTSQRISMIFDIRHLGNVAWSYYLEWAQLFNGLREETIQCVHRSAVITDSVVLRTAVNTFFMIYQTARPTQFATSYEDAYAYVTTGNVPSSETIAPMFDDNTAVANSEKNIDQKMLNTMMEHK